MSEQWQWRKRLPEKKSDAFLKVVLWSSWIVVPFLAFLFAYHFADASIWAAAGFALIGLFAVYLSSRERTTAEKAADLGRGVVVTIVITIALAWVQHKGEVRSARDNLALSLSSSGALPGIDLHDRPLSGFYLAGKIFDGANLSGAQLDGAVLRSASLRGANLEHADLRRANLFGANLAITANGSPVNLESARLDDANLTVAQMRGAKLRDARLRRANLAGVDLRNADLRDTDLSEASLLGADLRGAILAGAKLDGALLDDDGRPARLFDADLTGARWDAATVWPAGYPAAAIAQAKRPIPSPPVPATAHVGTVEGVLHGASFRLATGGVIRMLGVSTPSKRPRECWTDEADADVKTLLDGQRVRYTTGRKARDRFKRIQAYVWTDEGKLVNQEILARGDGRVLIVKPNTRYEQTFRRAQARAAGSGKGLWGNC